MPEEPKGVLAGGVEKLLEVEDAEDRGVAGEEPWPRGGGMPVEGLREKDREEGAEGGRSEVFGGFDTSFDGEVGSRGAGVDTSAGGSDGDEESLCERAEEERMGIPLERVPVVGGVTRSSPLGDLGEEDKGVLLRLRTGILLLAREADLALLISSACCRR